jgi:DNA-directed RNA polymerase specialized sigma24 family protein
MLGQLRNEIGKRAVASFCNAAVDEELVAAAKNGDELGFERLAKRHQRRIFALALRYTRVREDAEDLAQENFQKAFVYLQKFEGKSSFSTWLTRIAINEAPDVAAQATRTYEVPLDDSSGDHGTTAIGHLRPGMRRAVELRELGDLSTQETARRMGLSVAAH